MQSSRRKFIAQPGTLGASTGLAGIASGATFSEINHPDNSSASFALNILQTTDVHCQIHIHHGLF